MEPGETCHINLEQCFDTVCVTYLLEPERESLSMMSMQMSQQAKITALGS